MDKHTQPSLHTKSTQSPWPCGASLQRALFLTGWFLVLCGYVWLPTCPVVSASPQKSPFSREVTPTNPYNIQASRPFFWVKSSMAVFRNLGLSIDLQQGQQVWGSLNGSQLQMLQASGAAFQIQEEVTLPLPTPYLSLVEIEQDMQKLVQKYPGRVELVDVNRRWNTPKTAEGRSLLALRIYTQGRKQEPVPVVLLDATHHAREIITPLIALEAARTLLEQYGQNPDVTRWVDHYEIWIIPVVNPDGYHYVFTQDPFWRKNRRPLGNNDFGVDLNRNYPFQWGYCGNHSSDTKSEIFKGQNAASEPEVQTLLALGQALQPQLYLTYHSHGDEVVRLYVCAQTPEEKLVDQLTQQMASLAGYKSRKASSSGESFEHYYHQYGTLGFLIEVGKAFHPEPDLVTGLLVQARTTWQYLLDRGMKSAIHLRVVDQENQKPIVAEIAIDEIPFQVGEIRRTRPGDGFFAWTMLPGSYTLRVRAVGYTAHTQTISVPVDKIVSVVIAMSKPLHDNESVDSHEPVSSLEPKSEPKSEPRMESEVWPADLEHHPTESIAPESLQDGSPVEHDSESLACSNTTEHVAEVCKTHLESTKEETSSHACGCTSTSTSTSHMPWAWLIILCLMMGWRSRKT